MARRAVGIRRWKGSWQAYVQVRRKTYSKSFPLATDLDTMKAWRVAEALKHRPIRAIGGSFRADIESYLSRVIAMPSYKQRAAHLTLWARALGEDRPRQSITTADIERVMQGWLTTPSAPTKGRPSAPDGIAPATVRKRRTALLALFNKLDGPHATNPVRAAVPPRAPKPETRGLDYPTVRRILAAMPESVTKRRVTVLAYTGLPPSLLQTITPADLALKHRRVRVQPRRKGAGVEARTLELLPQGVAAFKAFAAADAFGVFAVEAANVSFKRACKTVNVQGVSLYDLRHSFGALLYRVTRDLATVSRFMLHASTATTERYAKAAMQSVDRAAADAVGRNLSLTPVPKAKTHVRKTLRRVS